MKKTSEINPWEIAFAVVYPGRYALFENRELVHKTLQNLAQLQNIQCFSPPIPAIFAGSAGNAVKAGEELWIEEHYLRSGEHPPMPRYMFARLVASIFQRYWENTDAPFCVSQRGIAQTRALRLNIRAL